MNWDDELIREELAALKEMDKEHFAGDRILLFRKSYEVERVIRGLEHTADLWVFVLEAKPGSHIYNFFVDPLDARDDGRNFNESDELIMALWTLVDENRVAAGLPATGITLGMLARTKAAKVRSRAH